MPWRYNKMNLTKKQVKELESFGYDPRTKGGWLDLYWNDFQAKEWEQVCASLKVDPNVEKVTIAYVGVQTGNIH